MSRTYERMKVFIKVERVDGLDKGSQSPCIILHHEESVVTRWYEAHASRVARLDRGVVVSVKYLFGTVEANSRIIEPIEGHLRAAVEALRSRKVEQEQDDRLSIRLE